MTLTPEELDRVKYLGDLVTRLRDMLDSAVRALDADVPISAGWVEMSKELLDESEGEG